MSEVISQIIIYLILVALIGGVIGYLIGKSSCEKESSCNEKVEGTHELHIDRKEQKDKDSISSDDLTNKPKEIGKKPTTLLLEPKNGEKDNLQLIKGIGKVLEKLLNDIGIYHFEQIANLTKDEIKWLDYSMAFPGRIERENWVTQAKELAQKSN